MPYATRAATDADAEAIFTVVCDAYKIELGDTGVAFKSANRFLTVDDARELLPDMDVLCRVGDDGALGDVVGCACVQVVDAGTVEEIGNPKISAYGRFVGQKYGFLGPIAISPALQVRSNSRCSRPPSPLGYH